MLKGCDIFVCLQLWRRQTWVGTANILDKAALVARKEVALIIVITFITIILTIFIHSSFKSPPQVILVSV